MTEVLPAPRLMADVEPRLLAEIEHYMLERADERMLAPARERGYELRLLGATVLPQQQTIVRSQWGKWMFVDHVKDPTKKQYRGKLPIPAEQHAWLTELERAGVRPDVVWLGHELPDTWREGDPLPVPAPARIRETDEQLTRGLGTFFRGLVKGAGLTLGFAAVAPLAPLALLGSDPIVLGGVRHPEVPVVQWALLAQWAWE